MVWSGRARQVLAGLFLLVGLLALLGVARAPADPLPLATATGVALLAVAAVVNLRAALALADRRNAEVESLNRILQGLSRSMSPDAVVGGIVNELRAATGADHCVVVRRRARSPILDATLVSASPGVPAASTTLPASLLETAPKVTPRMAAIPIDTGDERRRPIPVATPVRVATRATVATPATVVPALGRTLVSVAAARSVAGHPPLASLAPIESVGSGRAAPSGSAMPIGSAARTVSQVHPADVAGARIAEAARSYFGLKNTLAAPLVTSMGVEGALILSRRGAEDWPAESRRLLDRAADEASAALERAYVYVAAETAATTDALTGLPNRRYLEMLDAHVAGRRRHDLKGALMVDIDHFKQVNDRLGHARGDEVLRIVADRITRAVRREDIPIRYGGEEFLVILREADESVAVEVAQRVRRMVASADLGALGLSRPVTVSVGVAVARPEGAAGHGPEGAAGHGPEGATVARPERAAVARPERAAGPEHAAGTESGAGPERAAGTEGAARARPERPTPAAGPEGGRSRRRHAAEGRDAAHSSGTRAATGLSRTVGATTPTRTRGAITPSGTLADLIIRADVALYRAKTAGRDRVEVA